MRDDYDSPWKLILERYFPAFLDFFFPEVYADIDWTQGHESLEQELRQITHDAKISRHVCDKLVKVSKRSGEEGLVLIHAEIQNQQDQGFSRRMFTYNYRAFDRHGLPVASLAVLGDDGEKWKPDRFGYQLWRCQVAIEFPIVKLCDYNGRWEELEASPNPFAVVVLAHLQTQATRNNLEGRLQWKRRLVRGLYEHCWEREQIVDLFRFLDWMLRLPSELDRQLWSELKEFEKEKRMQYVTSVERFGIEEGMRRSKKRWLKKGMERGIQQGMERGIQQGMERGIQQGMERGIQRGEAVALERLLIRRFGALPSWAKKLLSGATLDQLASWLDRVVDAERLEDVLVET